MSRPWCDIVCADFGGVHAFLLLSPLRGECLVACFDWGLFRRDGCKCVRGEMSCDIHLTTWLRARTACGGERGGEETQHAMFFFYDLVLYSLRVSHQRSCVGASRYLWHKIQLVVSKLTKQEVAASEREYWARRVVGGSTWEDLDEDAR